MLLGKFVGTLEHPGGGGDRSTARRVSLGHDAEVAAAGPGRIGFGEVGVAGVEPGGRKELGAAAVEGADLLTGATDRRRGRHDLGSDTFAVGAQPEHGRLIEADGGAERAGEQVQLVLDDQVRRAVPGVSPEQPSRARFPGEPGELVHRAENEGRRPVVHLFVDDGDGQLVVEDALVTWAEKAKEPAVARTP